MPQIASDLENNHTGRNLSTTTIRLGFLIEILERFQNTPSLRSLSAQMPRSVVRSLSGNDWFRGKRYSGPRSEVPQWATKCG